MSATHTVPEDHRKPAHRVDASRVWAVLIGIDKYSSSYCPILRGCVNDVKKMAEFLINDLGMSEGRIHCLLSTSPDTPNLSIGPEERRIVIDVTSPTRENIVDKLFNLSTNPEIQHGDSIIIYFSGHGSAYICPDYYGAGTILAEGSIEALCPMDRTASGADINIPDISDREINTILTEISRTKGPHITVILDCCYSSGITRDASSGERRTDPLPPTSIRGMLEAAHTRFGGLAKYHSILEENWSPDMTSYVVLAACTEYQVAKEEKGPDGCWNGIFTRALIEALKSDSLKEESTYDDLISAVKMPDNATQMPVVAGNVNARLWYQPEMSKKVSSSRSEWLLGGVGVGIGLIAWLRG